LGGPADPIVWGMSALPVMAFCSLMNLVWVALILVNARKGGGWGPIISWLFVVVLWFGANWYDNVRSYNGSEMGGVTGVKSEKAWK